MKNDMYRLTALLLLFGCVTYAQPATEIYLFDVKSRKGKTVLSNPRNISQHPGYDNQPFFHPQKSVVLFTSANSEGRTDIVEYNYRTGERRLMTKTTEKEYSPTVTPDFKYISCIVQRDNGAQDLARYPVDGGEPEILINDLTVGYHSWINANTVLVFTLPAPFQLQRVDLSTNSKQILADSIGRSIHKIPKQEAMSFTRRTGQASFDIMRYDFSSGKISTIVGGINASEVDMCWMPGGKILRTEGSSIYIYDEISSQWEQVAVKTQFRLAGLTRIAISPDSKFLALVVNE